MQSIVPGFPSVIYIFAHHPLYRAFAHAHAAIGLSAVDDQQLAGVVAKVATLPVLWAVAAAALARAAREDASGSDTAVLTWSEVERQLERAERLDRRRPRRHPRRPALRPRVGIPPGSGEPGTDEPGTAPGPPV